MPASIRKIISALRLYKLGIIPLLMNRLLSGVFSYNNIIFYDVDLSDEASLFPPETPGLTVRKIRDADDELFRRLLQHYPGHNFEDRINKPNRDCYVALYEGEPVGYAWIIYRVFEVGELNYAYPLEEDEFFIYDCFVSAGYRGQGIYPSTLRTILLDYSREGRYRRACIGVSFANEGSRRGVLKAGFREYNRIRHLRLFGWEKWWGIEREPADMSADNPNEGKPKNLAEEKE